MSLFFSALAFLLEKYVGQFAGSPSAYSIQLVSFYSGYSVQPPPLIYTGSCVACGPQLQEPYFFSDPSETCTVVKAGPELEKAGSFLWPRILSTTELLHEGPVCLPL